MKSAILTVGTEILFGQITNTNSVYLSQQLQMLGYDVMYHYTVGDNSHRLMDTLDHIFEDCDLILATGGLGPTQDDLTKEIVCEYMKDELVPHQPSIDALNEYVSRTGRKMTENNWKQTNFPSKATVFPNDMGTAPGFASENEKGKIVICMPGPPREMKHMFEAHVRPFLASRSDSIIYYKVLRLYGIGESKLETELMDLVDGQTDPTLATYAKEGECSVRVTSKRESGKEARQAVEAMVEQVRQRVGQFIYSEEDEDLVNVVARRLMERDISISSAESCTGGWFAKTLTDVPGISSVFDRGLVTYSNQAKMEELGVRQETLEKYGAVSRQTALEMAVGLQKVTGSRLCISVTGVAGPDGGTADKPVGLIYFCATMDGRTILRESDRRNRSRAWNRNYSVLTMLDMVRELLDKAE